MSQGTLRTSGFPPFPPLSHLSRLALPEQGPSSLGAHPLTSTLRLSVKPLRHRLPEASGAMPPSPLSQVSCPHHSVDLPASTRLRHVSRGLLSRCLPPIMPDSARSEQRLASIPGPGLTHIPVSTMASPALDVLAQGYSVMAVRSTTSTASLYLPPTRPTSTAADQAHTPGLRGFVRNPSAFVAPWISKDVASNIDDIGTSYHESLNLVAAASHLGTSGASLIILRGIHPTREGVLNATLVTRERFEATNLLRIGTSDHQEFHGSQTLVYHGALGDLALDHGTGFTSWRSRVLPKLGLPRLAELAQVDDTLLSAFAMRITGYSISGKDLGPAGALPIAWGDGGPVPHGGLAWVFPLSTTGLIPAGGGLPDFSRLSRRDLAGVLTTWDVVVARSIDPAGREILDMISATFTPRVKDLIR